MSKADRRILQSVEEARAIARDEMMPRRIHIGNKGNIFAELCLPTQKITCSTRPWSRDLHFALGQHRTRVPQQGFFNSVRRWSGTI